MKFQCLRSGNFIELFEPDDIKNMASNESYKEVIEEVKVDEQAVAKEPVVEKKKPGRPAKNK